MDRRIGDHRVNEGDVVHTSRHMRKKIAHPFAALAILLEVPFGTDNPALILLPSPAKRLHRDGFTIQLVELGLVIESVHLTRSAVHEKEDYTFRFRRKMRRLRREWVGKFGNFGGAGLKELVERKQAGKSEASEAS